MFTNTRQFIDFFADKFSKVNSDDTKPLNTLIGETKSLISSQHSNTNSLINTVNSNVSKKLKFHAYYGSNPLTLTNGVLINFSADKEANKIKVTVDGVNIPVVDSGGSIASGVCLKFESYNYTNNTFCSFVYNDSSAPMENLNISFKTLTLTPPSGYRFGILYMLWE